MVNYQRKSFSNILQATGRAALSSACSSFSAEELKHAHTWMSVTKHHVVTHFLSPVLSFILSFWVTVHVLNNRWRNAVRRGSLRPCVAEHGSTSLGAKWKGSRTGANSRSVCTYVIRTRDFTENSTSWVTHSKSGKCEKALKCLMECLKS